MSTPASVLLASRHQWLRPLLVGLLMLSSVAARTQTQPSYFFLGAKEFDGVQIYDVIQDDELNYWIATDNGLYTYDSYHFTKAVFAGAQSVSVFGFVKNKTGTIYCYNLNNQILQIRYGVCSLLYELKADERSADIYLSITPQNELLVLTKTALLFTEAGVPVAIAKPKFNYYGFPFLTPYGQIISHIADTDSVLVYENRTFKREKMQRSGEPFDGVLKFFTLNDHSYAISSAGKKIYAFDDWHFILTRLPSTALEKNSEPYRLYNENNQAWTAGVTAGVYLLSENEGALTLSNQFYPQFLISDVYKDAEGNLLFSTFNNGILVVPDMHIPDVLNIPAGQSIMSIQGDEQLGMLMGTLTGKLLSYSDGAYRTLSDSGARPLQSIFSWPEFPFVIFDDGRVKALNKKTGEIIPLALGSLKDAVYTGDSVVYLAMNIGVSKLTWKGGNKFTCLSVSGLRLRTYAIAYSPDDALIYVATSDGVKMLDTAGNVQSLMHNGKTVFASDICSAEGMIYLASGHEILACSARTVQRILPLSILGKAVDVTKLEVRDGVFNTITSAGFALFGTDGALITHLNTQQGFSTNRIYDFEKTGNSFWICHSKGVQQLNPSTLAAAPGKPAIQFGRIAVNDDENWNEFQTSALYSNQRKIAFTLSSPTLRNQENIRYHYQLAGYDEKWYTANYSANEIVYNALAPGEYVFTVKAENAGVFSEPRSFSFSIAKPFYSTWWFIAFISIVVLLIVTLVYRYRLQQQQKKAQLENELHASRLTAIQSQMNPHFIFNSLNSIQDLVLKGDVDNSYTFITKFSNLVRRTLNYSDKDFIGFGQEIKLLELYLSLEKLRFRDDLEFSLETEGIDDIMIPPMLIQPFIENSLLHGLLHKEGKKKLSIRFHLGEHLTCIIEDNGIGREKAREIKNRQRAEHESFAGQAIKKRFSILSRIFRSELGYIYEDMYNGHEATGTRVRLIIPVKRNF
jgi:hypothetical protein